VLVHGLATTRLIWRRVVPRLGHRRAVALDVPGFGASPPAGPGFALDAVAAAIGDGLAQAGVPRPFDLVGHSMGGALALSLAARHPESVRRLVLVAPAGLRPVPRPAAEVFAAVSQQLIALRRAGAPLADSAWGRRLLLAGGTVDAEGIPPAEARAMVLASRGATRIRAALAAVVAADLRPALTAVQAPLGLVWGARDRVIPATGIDAVLERRPGAPAVRVPEAGHIAMMERPAAFARALEEILERLDGQSAAARRARSS
jgi:3-oxoadipate enol-lactonase